MKRLVLALLLAAVPAFADSAGPATAVVKTANDTIAKELKDKAPAKNVIKSVNAFIDIDAIGKQALGDAWSTMKADEQKAFLEKLHTLVEAKWLEGSNANPDYIVDYQGESTMANGDVLVKTKITAKKKGRPVEFQIDYELAKQGNQMRATDVVMDESSLVKNYSTEFSKIIKKDGVTGLLALMDKKIASLPKP